MVRATLRSAVLLGLLACSVPAYAEVQNVKVGGEATVRSFFRKSLRLNEGVINGTGGGSTTVVDSFTADHGSSGDAFLQQLTAVDVGADLTENVSTQVRLINQRVWGSFADDATDTPSANANQVQLSLANVTLKELFYSPLTVTVGRQRLWFGRGFVVGNRLVRGDNDPDTTLAADEFSDLTAFDAIRGTLDLSGVLGGVPLVVDGVYAKVDENDVSITGTGDSSRDDANLIGVNLGTKLDSMNSELEAYFWTKRDRELAFSAGFESEHHPQANTLGFRGSMSPAEGLSTWGELAYQWGRRITSSILFDAEGAPGSPFQAWATDLGLDYTMKGTAWTPTLGGEWIFYSGDEGNATAIGGWDPIYRGAFSTLLREFQAAGFYMPAQSGATIIGSTTYNTITNSTTNQHQLALHAAVRPLEDLKVDNRLTWFIADKGVVPAPGAKRENFFGTEWDVKADYAYTDDVALGLVYGLFLPGNVFRDPFDSSAQELVTSVSVKF